MHRRAIAILILFALLWQSVAMAAPGWAFNQVQDLAHSVLHWSGDAHHHHDDGSYHQDDSDESVQHVIADAGLQAATLLNSARSDFARLGVSSPAMTSDAVRPPPYIDGPHRPPRSAA
jgi:hypothetical protein